MNVSLIGVARRGIPAIHHGANRIRRDQPSDHRAIVRVAFLASCFFPQLLGINSLICMLFVLGAGCAFKEGGPAAVDEKSIIHRSSLNVKDFGAKGDDLADDTKAIQRALNKAGEIAASLSMNIGNMDGWCHGYGDNAMPEVVFPAGTYKTSGTLVSKRCVFLRGVGKAVLRQSNPSKDSFYLHGALRFYAEDLTFDGGKNQIKVWTGNNDSATVIINNCEFQNSSDAAFWSKSYQLPEKVNGIEAVAGPFKLEWDKDGMPHLSESDISKFRPWANSTLISIRRSSFKNCALATEMHSDTITMKDCAIENSLTKPGAVIFKGHGEAHFFNLRCRAKGTKDGERYWFETANGRFSCRDSEFQSSEPMCLLKTSGKPNYIPTSVVVENCKVNSGGNKLGGIVFCESVPNIIAIRGVSDVSGKNVPAVKFEKEVDAELLKSLKYREWPVEEHYRFCVADNSANIDASIPAALNVYACGPIQEGARKAVFVPRVDLRWQEFTGKIDKILYAEDFGVDLDRKTDDTMAVQRVFDEAAKHEHPLLIFPGRVYNLSKTITLPSNVTAKAAGIAYFVGGGRGMDLFKVEKGGDIAFKNFNFINSADGFNITTLSSTKSNIFFENCFFWENWGAGIRCLSGSGEASEQNKTTILAVNGGMFNMRGIVTNARHVMLDALWAVNYSELNDEAFIKNLGGSMRTEALLACPKAWYGEKMTRMLAKTTVKEQRVWKLGKNLRWIDNYGSVYSIDTRWGGENEGVPAVYNWTDKGSVSINGGFVWFFNNYVTNCVVYYHSTPRFTVLEDIVSVPMRFTNNTIWKKSSDCSGDIASHLWKSCVLVPE